MSSWLIFKDMNSVGRKMSFVIYPPIGLVVRKWDQTKQQFVDSDDGEETEMSQKPGESTKFEKNSQKAWWKFY